MTKIKRAVVLIESNGKNFARAHFQKRLDDLMAIYDKRNFSHVCEKSALETTIEFIDKHKEVTE